MIIKSMTYRQRLFDMTVIKVSSDADKKDSLYWKSTQTIPNTTEELKAYQKN